MPIRVRFHDYFDRRIQYFNGRGNVTKFQAGKNLRNVYKRQIFKIF